MHEQNYCLQVKSCDTDAQTQTNWCVQMCDDNMTCLLWLHVVKSHTESCLALPSTQHAPGHRQKEPRCLLGSEIGHVRPPWLQHVVHAIKQKEIRKSIVPILAVEYCFTIDKFTNLNVFCIAHTQKGIVVSRKYISRVSLAAGWIFLTSWKACSQLHIFPFPCAIFLFHRHEYHCLLLPRNFSGWYILREETVHPFERETLRKHNVLCLVQDNCSRDRCSDLFKGVKTCTAQLIDGLSTLWCILQYKLDHVHNVGYIYSATIQNVLLFILQVVVLCIKSFCNGLNNTFYVNVTTKS